MEYTKGNWEYHEQEWGFGISTDQHTNLAIIKRDAAMRDELTIIEDKANAKLIAAAPDMLQTLQGIVAHGSLPKSVEEVVNMVIDKATK